MSTDKKKQAEYARRWYHKNRQQCLERQRQWEKRNPGRKRDYRLRRTYGLTIGQYDKMLVQQGGRCAICTQTSSTALNVDHDHSTGAVRALLCGECNRGLGAFKDNRVTLQAALNYLTKHHV